MVASWRKDQEGTGHPRLVSHGFEVALLGPAYPFERAEHERSPPAEEPPDAGPRDGAGQAVAALALRDGVGYPQPNGHSPGDKA
jgi:hypothetical protein